MNMMVQIALALLSTAASDADVPAGGWQSAGRVLTYSEAGAPVYVLDCTGTELAVTQYGVTQLLDVKQNKPVSDREGTSLPEGAAFMALATDKVEEPRMIAAAAVRNARAGWDMTIRLRKNDPTFRSLPRAKMISLFTTGFTRMVMPSKEEKAMLAAFVNECRAGG
jgi:hypothetical protein